MSAEILRRAAALMRERAEAATEGPWVETVVNGLPIVFDTKPLPEPVVYDHELTRGNAEHIASWHPAVALAVADWLDDIAERHSEGPPTELVLHYDDGPCDVCDDGGHEVTICEGCFPTWEGMDGYCVYPCRETKAALTVARAYLGEAADD